MAYMRHADAPQIDSEAIERLAQLVGLTIPPEDIAPLTVALGDYLVAFAAVEELDLNGIDSMLVFDPRWSEDGRTFATADE